MTWYCQHADSRVNVPAQMVNLYLNHIPRWALVAYLESFYMNSLLNKTVCVFGSKDWASLVGLFRVACIASHAWVFATQKQNPVGDGAGDKPRIIFSFAPNDMNVLY